MVAKRGCWYQGGRKTPASPELTHILGERATPQQGGEEGPSLEPVGEPGAGTLGLGPRSWILGSSHCLCQVPLLSGSHSPHL